ncbi:MAG: TetR/AcrR family transcriptional regulator [Gaiellaceae bacterium]
MAIATERKSKEERRDEIIDAAQQVFAERGYQGASTEEIARRAGISQPYVFRLFGTKKDLFLAVNTRCFRMTLEIFQRAAEGLRGEAAMIAIGQAYGRLLQEDRTYLRGQMAAYAACDDPQICAAVRDGFGDLVAYVERVSDADPTRVASFFAKGMLMNVLSSMGLQDPSEPWARRLIDGLTPAEG